MKKGLIGGIVLIGLILGAFFWLAAGGSAKHAPQEVITVDLPDSYER